VLKLPFTVRFAAVKVPPIEALPDILALPADKAPVVDKLPADNAPDILAVLEFKEPLVA